MKDNQNREMEQMVEGDSLFYSGRKSKFLFLYLHFTEKIKKLAKKAKLSIQEEQEIMKKEFDCPIEIEEIDE